MASDFIGGGLPSTAAHTDPTVLPTNESPAAIRALEPPASNPGSDDPSGGIAKDAGGLSCTAHLGSPVTQEHEKTTVVGSVYDSVFGKTERSAAEHESTPNTAAVTSSTSEQQASGTGAAGLLGGIAGSVAAGTAAVAAAVGLNQTAETPQEQGEKTAASVEKSTAETQAVAGEKAAEASDSAKATANEASTAIAGKSEPTEPQDPTKMAEKEDSSKAMEQEKSPKPVETEETKEKAKDEDGNVDEEKAKKVEDHKAAVRTNEDAIPTAGGEKLGQAHEGESKIIPDVPPKAVNESTPGQPDQTTVDNTAKNAGNAPADAAPPATHSGLGQKGDSTESTGKPKFMDRVKAKLHLEKKDKP